MIYLIFGDVHGNLPALEKLLKIEDRYDRIISHGDIVNYGPWSNECVELLSSIPEIISLRGNHEDNFLSGSYSGTHPVATAFFNFCYPGFKRYDLIQNYHSYHELGDFTVQHTINDQYIYPDTDLSKHSLKGNFIIGHSHYQFNKLSGTYQLVNTGSLGQNRKFINVAEYVLYDDRTGNVELKSFTYDIDEVISRMQNLNYPQICIDYYQNKRRYQ